MRRQSVVPALIGSIALAVLSSGTAVAGHAAFSDTAGTTHEAGIHWLAESRIAGGCGNGKFCPDDAVKRGQLASFLRRLSGNDPAVAPSVNAATVGGFAAEELRGTSPVLAQAASTGATTIEQYASRHTSAAVAEMSVVVAPGTKQMVQVLVTYEESYSVKRSVTPNCGVGVDPQPSAPKLRLDGSHVYDVYAGAHPDVVHYDNANGVSATTRLAYIYVTTLDEGAHTFSLNLEGACGDTGSAGVGTRTVQDAHLSAVGGATFRD